MGKRDMPTRMVLALLYTLLSIATFTHSANSNDLSRFRCDFDNRDACNWVMERQGGTDQQWRFQRGFDFGGGSDGGGSDGSGSDGGGSDPSSTLPSSDHTSGVGFGSYAFVASSISENILSQATLRSPEMELPPSGMCLDFWYFMHGEDSGRLEIALRASESNASESNASESNASESNASESNASEYNASESNASETRVLWTRRGCQGSDWRHAQVRVDVPMSNGSRKVAVTITARNDSSGVNVAIDDVNVTDGPCMSTYSCDFDDFLAKTCSYTQSSENDFDWGFAQVVSGRSVNVEVNESLLCSNETSASYKDTMCANLTRGDSLTFLEDKDQSKRFGSGHALDQSGNQYLNIDTLGIPQEARKGDKAILISPALTDNTPICIRFWYNVMGPAFLDVIISHDTNRNRTLGSYSGEDFKGWRLATTDVQSESPFRILFQTSVQSGQNRIRVSIDSIDVRHGNCLDLSASCDFEDTMCPWHNDPDRDHLRWTRAMGGQAKPVKYVHTDHSLGSRYGKYLLLDGSTRVDGKTTGRLVSPSLLPETTYCLEFWYIIVGEHATLHIRLEGESSNGSIPLHSLEGPQSPFWKSFRTSIPKFQTNSRLVIEGVISRPGQGYDILLDDLYLRNETCESLRVDTSNSVRDGFHCREDKLQLSRTQVCDFHNDCSDGEEETRCGYSCTFETDDCRWTSTSNKKDNWNRTSRAELPGTLGAKVDHTSGRKDGHFLYLLDFSSILNVLVTTLKSPMFRRSSPSCELSFYVNPLEPNNWKISVYKITDTRRVRIYSVSKLVKNVWQKLTASIGFSREPFQVQIISERISQYISCIALDDISFDNCDYPLPTGAVSANNTEFTCRDGSVLNISRVCDFAGDCRDSSDEIDDALCSNYTRCDFENDTCGWRQEKELDDFDWLRQRANVSEGRDTGPDLDHTTGFSSGFVLQMTHQSRLPGDTAWLLSPVLEATTNCRMSFHIYLYGMNVDRFNVYTRREVGGSLSKHWSTFGEIGRVWIFKSLTFSSPSPFQIVVEGIKGYGQLGDIAVDDVSLSPQCSLHRGRLGVKRTPAKVTPDPCQDTKKWQCRDSSSCIYRFQVCDFTPQCPDQSDEENCGNCDFESSTCGWTDITRGGVVWERVNSTSVSGYMKPSRDNTYKTPGTGWYMKVTDTGNGYTRISTLISPVIGHTTPSCTITFYYWSTRQSGIELYLMSANVTDFEYSQNGMHYAWRSDDRIGREWRKNENWVKASVNIGSLGGHFRLLFSHRRIVHLPEIAFALDDVSFSPSCGGGNALQLCETDEFRCYSSGQCMSEHNRCDFVKDCPDGEDEVSCKDDYKMDGFRYSKDWFLNDRTSDFKWKRWSGHVHTKESRPRWDLDEKSWAGRYLYMSASKSRAKKKIEKSRIRSYVLLPNPQGDCFMRLFYQFAGDRRGKVQIYTMSKQKGPRTLLWTMPKEKLTDWKKVVLQLKSNVSFRVFIEGTRRGKYGGGVAIDAISFNRHCFFHDSGVGLQRKRISDKRQSCKADEFSCNSTCVSLSKCGSGIHCAGGDEILNCPTSCTFEHGMCGWTQKRWPKTKSAKWKINLISKVGSGDSKPKGPPGKVLLAGSSSQKKESAKHLIISPVFKRVSRLCTFSLMYYYSGKPIFFSINRRMAGYDQRLLFRTNRETPNSRGGQWNRVVVSIPSFSELFQIVIKLSMKNMDNGSFFILDNFNFRKCALRPLPDRCASNQFRCADGACVSVDQICDLERDCRDGSDEELEVCSNYTQFTFESGMQGWKNLVGTKHSWEIKHGLVPYYTEYRRPSADHTRHSLIGRYLSTSRTSGAEDEAKMLYDMPASNGACEIFFWYLIDCAKSSCYITVRTLTHDDVWGPEWKFSHQWASNFWMRARVSVEINEPYRLIFEGHLDNNKLSTLNVDDIVFSPRCLKGPTPSHASNQETFIAPKTIRPYPSGECLQTHFRCLDFGICLDMSHMCNGHQDCPFGSDEYIQVCRNFAFFDFEDELPLRRFQRVKGDNADWLIWNSSLPLPESFSQVDKSLRFINNHFLLAVGTRGASFSDTSSILYLPYFTTKRSCMIRAHVMIPSDQQAVTLNYRTDLPGAEDQPLDSIGPRAYGLLWQPLTVTVTTDRPFRLVIKAVLGMEGGAVAIDDVMMGPGCTPVD